MLCHEIFSLFGKLENINIVGSFDNAAYSSIDGVLFNAAKDTLLYYPAAHNKDSGVYTLPTAALNIAERAFYTNPSSTKIKSTVKDILRRTLSTEFLPGSCRHKPQFLFR